MARGGRLRRPAYLPVDFPLFGVANWAGPRWLECVSGPDVDGPVHEVWFAHRRAGASGYIVVGCLRRSTNDQTTPRVDRDMKRHLAHLAAFSLVNVTAPDVGKSAGAFWGRLMGLVDSATDTVLEWETVPWEVAAEPVNVPIWRFAGGWCGFTDTRSDVYLVMYGTDGGPEDRRLERIDDGARYGFDLTAPLRPRNVHGRPEIFLLDGPPSPHSDHESILPDSGSSLDFCIFLDRSRLWSAEMY